VPFELVDDVLARTGTVQQRLRDLPSRVGVYFALAMVLFPRVGYQRVWGKLVAGLRMCSACPGVPSPSAKALRDLRRRIGVAPLKMLFDVLAGPLGQPHTPGVRWRGLRTVAFDGCSSIRVPATPRNWLWLGRVRYRSPTGATIWPSYPTIRLMVLIETGTRALMGAVIGSGTDRDEPSQAQRLFGLLKPGMLVLADRAFDRSAFISGVVEAGAHLLIRGTSSRRPVVLAHLSDGSFLTIIDGLRVRVLTAEVIVTGKDGSRVRDTYRLLTTLLDHQRYPAEDLVALYHERWEIEIAFYEICHTIIDGHTLRSGDQPGLEQEIWAMLVLYQLLRTAMLEAIESMTASAATARLNPDRASFTVALETARDQVVLADEVLPDHADPLRLGAIETAVIAAPLPQRRARWSSRKVKRRRFRWSQRDDGSRPDLPTKITSIDIAINTPAPIDPNPEQVMQRRAARASRGPAAPQRPPRHTRRTTTINLMETDPERLWSGKEIAEYLNAPPRNILTQLAEWSRHGWLEHHGKGLYSLPTHRPMPLPTAASA
jgi:hypothetical protein